MPSLPFEVTICDLQESAPPIAATPPPPPSTRNLPPSRRQAPLPICHFPREHNSVRQADACEHFQKNRLRQGPGSANCRRRNVRSMSVAFAPMVLLPQRSRQSCRALDELVRCDRTENSCARSHGSPTRPTPGAATSSSNPWTRWRVCKLIPQASQSPKGGNWQSNKAGLIFR